MCAEFYAPRTLAQFTRRSQESSDHSSERVSPRRAATVCWLQYWMYWTQRNGIWNQIASLASRVRYNLDTYIVYKPALDGMDNVSSAAGVESNNE